MTFELFVGVQCITQVCINICLFLESALLSKNTEIHIQCCSREKFMVFLSFIQFCITGKVYSNWKANSLHFTEQIVVTQKQQILKSATSYLSATPQKQLYLIGMVWLMKSELLLQDAGSPSCLPDTDSHCCQSQDGSCSGYVARSPLGLFA